MATHPALVAIPSGSTAYADLDPALLLAYLIGSVGLFIPTATDPTTVDPTGPGGTVAPWVVWSDRMWVYDPDSTADHDALTCIVLSTGKHYLTDELRAPDAVEAFVGPSDPDPFPGLGDAYGTAYIPLAGSVVDDDDHPNEIGVHTARGTRWVVPREGLSVWVVADKGYWHFDADEDAWVAGPGAFPVPAGSIRPTHLQTRSWSFENQTLEAPPGARLTGGTPSMPFGGTAANINDDSVASTATTGALGDLTAAAVADRIVASIDFGSVKDLIAIEGKQLSASAASSASAVRFYTSTDGVSWTGRGASFTLDTTPIDVRRDAPTTWSAQYIAIVTEAKNWGSDTHTVADLNGYDGTVTCTAGAHWVIGASPFGILAGYPLSIAACEADDTITILTPRTGEIGFDKALGISIRWGGTAWEPAGGTILQRASVRTTSGSGTAPSGSTAYSYSATVAPTTSACHWRDDGSLTIAAVAAGKRLWFHYRADVDLNTSGVATDLVMMLLRDSESTAIDWCRAPIPAAFDEPVFVEVSFEIDASDLDPHTYKVALVGVTEGVGSGTPIVTRRIFKVEESPIQ